MKNGELNFISNYFYNEI